MNIKTAFGSYLKSEDIGPHRPIVVMSHVAMEMVSTGDEKEKKAVLYFAGKDRGLILNKTNADTIISLTGTAETDQWSGQPIRLYVDPTVRFGGKLVSAIRIMSATTNGPVPSLPQFAPPPQSPPRPSYPAPAEYGLSADDEDCPF